MSESRELSWLEETAAILLSDSRDEGLRRATALLEREPTHFDAALWLVHALTREGEEVGEYAEALLHAFSAQSDLPAAAACAQLAVACGRDGGPLYAKLAKLFGRRSARLSKEAALAPPLLPAAAEVASELAELEGTALLSRATAALDGVLGAISDDEVLVDDTFEVQPSALFSALSPDALKKLLRVLALRELRHGEVAIEQGDEGDEAFVVVRGQLRAQRDQEPGQALAHLGRRTIFGEMALVTEAPRAATVVAEEPTLLLVMSREALESIARQDAAVGRELADFGRERMMANLMRRGSILNAVPEEQREQLVARFETKNFQAGEVLVELGEEPPGLYLIASGHVRVTAVDSDGDRLELAELGPGDVVGEIGLILRRPATATCTATHPTLTLFLAHADFASTIREHPTLLSELYAIATQRDEENRRAVSEQALDVDNLVLI